MFIYGCARFETSSVQGYPMSVRVWAAEKKGDDGVFCPVLQERVVIRFRFPESTPVPVRIKQNRTRSA